jgi:hypothetical protein
MFAPLVLLGVLLAHVAADTPAFQASPSIAANTSFILSAADQIISKHPSSHIIGTFLLDIGSNQSADIYTVWPVLSF